jgi:uncharacterized protein
VNVLVEKNVPVRMRDGVCLATDIYRPQVASRCPTLINRLPYDKELFVGRDGFFDVLRGVQHGYSVVVQDSRGRFHSNGSFRPFIHEADDGEDTIAWAASQSWASGSVGTFGSSYHGATQWCSASRTPPALRAMAPSFTSDQFFDGWAYRGGAFQLGLNLLWALQFLASGELRRRIATGAARAEDFRSLVVSIDGLESLYRQVPQRGLSALAEVAPYYNEWLDHPEYDEFWRSTSTRESYERITAPALNFGGWYDIFLKGTLANYVGMRERGGNELARRPRLVIGPWGHGPVSGWFSERNYGLLAGKDAIDATGMQLRWFDWLLKGEANGVESEKPVRLFVMGPNIWRDEDDWPLPDTRYVAYFLHSGGRANTAKGDGVLSTDPPGDQAHDIYVYDPRDPVPTVGGATFLPGLTLGVNMGPRDQRQVEARHDVLCYTSDVLERPLEVVGPLTVVLYVSSSALDTDFTAKLIEVWPDGRAESVADGIQRARYRNSLSDPSLLHPGEVYELSIDLIATANVFNVGNRVRLEVSSSNFPRFDRNTNTGGTIATEGAQDFVRAINRVYHTRDWASRLILPVIDRALCVRDQL